MRREVVRMGEGRYVYQFPWLSRVGSLSFEVSRGTSGAWFLEALTADARDLLPRQRRFATKGAAVSLMDGLVPP